MSTPQLEFPGLYNSADTGAAKAQTWFWRTIASEYFLLFWVSVLASFRQSLGMGPGILTLFLVLLGLIFILKVLWKSDQDWYRCRALAESVKTAAWRFSMRAHPFEDAKSIKQPQAEFRSLLQDILKANQHLSKNLDPAAGENESTPSMNSARKLSLKERIGFYVTHRIDDQRKWYARKSKANKDAFHFWIGATLFIYLLAIISVNGDAFNIPWSTYGFDPLVVVVTSCIGWMQIKRHSELTASYNLTAHEIGIIRGKSAAVSTEQQFSEFVNEAERAFSREHTQWVARRDTE
jgi:hypothetical protein